MSYAVLYWGSASGIRIQTDFDERDDGMKVDGKTIAGESAGIEIAGKPQNVKRKRRTEWHRQT
jgi:hypothetical protein